MGIFSFSESSFLSCKNYETSAFISSIPFKSIPWGSLPSGDIFLTLAKPSAFSLAFLSILLNLAIVSTFAFKRESFSLSYYFLSSSNLSIITLKSTSLDCLTNFNFFYETIAFYFKILSIISPNLSAKNGKDQEKRSSPCGKLNGYSTSLYYLIFILSFSIKITAPLFLYEPQ